jgi:hypothetical protein
MLSTTLSTYAHHPNILLCVSRINHPDWQGHLKSLGAVWIPQEPIDAIHRLKSWMNSLPIAHSSVQTEGVMLVVLLGSIATFDMLEGNEKDRLSEQEMAGWVAVVQSMFIWLLRIKDETVWIHNRMANVLACYVLSISVGNPDRKRWFAALHSAVVVLGQIGHRNEQILNIHTYDHFPPSGPKVSYAVGIQDSLLADHLTSDFLPLSKPIQDSICYLQLVLSV